MIKLCGFSASNYHNKVKLVLLEKDIPFDEELVYPSHDESFTSRSPLRKIPFLETEDGIVNESQPIVEYLEDAYPDRPLYPADAFARARVRSMIQLIELYLEWPARRLYPSAMFGQPEDAALNKEVEGQLRRGLRALAATARFSPFICGEMFTVADCVAFSHFPTIAGAAQVIYGRNVFDDIPQVKPYLAMLKERPHFQRVNSDRKANVEAFMAYRKAKAAG